VRHDEFRSRDKKVHKLGRDGLVEQNKATGEERRISGRTEDVSFGRKRDTEEAVQRKSGLKSSKKKRRKQPAPQVPELIASIGTPATESLPDTSLLPEAVPEMRGEAVPEMRGAVDMPMLVPPPELRSETEHPRRKRRSSGKRRIYDQRDGARLREKYDAAVPESPKFGKKRRTTEFSITPEAEDTPVRSPPFPTPDAPPEKPFIETGERLCFEEEQDLPKPDSTSLPHSQRGKLSIESGGRLCFEKEQDSSKPDDASLPRPKRVKLSIETGGRLSFEKEQDLPKPNDTSPTRSQRKSTQKRRKQSRLRFDDEPASPKDSPPTEPTDTATMPDSTEASAVPGMGTGTSVPSRRQRKQYAKSERRVEQTSRKLEKAQSKLPVKRRIYLEKKYDSNSGKARHLRFEEEIQPEYKKPSLPLRAGRLMKTAAVMKLHSKIHESERENTALEAAHKSELAMEQGIGRFLHWNRNRLCSKPYRAVRRAERKSFRAQADLAWRATLWEHPDLQQQPVLKRWHQRQAMRKKYAQAVRDGKQSFRFAQNLAAKTGSVFQTAVQYVSAQKTVLPFIAAAILVVTLFSAGLTSCTAVFSSLQSGYLSEIYLANEEDICQSDLYFTELETDLQLSIDSTEANFPGYDEYRYSVGEISHSPYELLSYLSAAYGAFTFEDVKEEIDRIFGEKYQLTRTPLTETHYDSHRRPYEVTVLQTTLTVRRMADIFSASLTPEQAESYNAYMKSYGGRQVYSNPFDFPWLEKVSNAYGWRVHPVSGEKDLHRGVDIAAAQGTAVRAIQDGRVAFAGEDGDYGLCAVIENAQGYQSRYALCASLNVTEGQEVRRGDVIASVGSTGLHLEIKLDGEYLNPYFFVETGGNGGSTLPGTSDGPVIPNYPGEPPTDETYAAMLAEAEKYLGFPYVWGGSSPATSFDCSGFVSWVINHSGWNVGRLGAKGLYNICTPVSPDNARPGDLVFFINTYDAPDPNAPTHCGIYVGNKQMIHCGNPISYANLNSSYWQSHFYAYARLP
jgi:murein DD-endopeptidase MepM/ murein hydrolase activator NlpD